MQNIKPQQLQGAHGGRALVGWCPSRPHQPVRAYHRKVLSSAALRDPVSALDLIQWPEGTRPKRGGITKASLTRLKVCAASACIRAYSTCMHWSDAADYLVHKHPAYLQIDLPSAACCPLVSNLALAAPFTAPGSAICNTVMLITCPASGSSKVLYQSIKASNPVV